MRWLVSLLLLFPNFVFAVDVTCGLLWDIPLERIDNTPLLQSEIQEYRIYLGINGPVDTSSPYAIASSPPSNVLVDLPEGTHTLNFQVKAVDTSGKESALSNVYSKSATVVISPPKAPTNLRDSGT